MKASWELNCFEILPGSGIPDKFLNPVQEVLKFFSPVQEILAEKGDPNPGTSRMAQYTPIHLIPQIHLW